MRLLASFVRKHNFQRFSIINYSHSDVRIIACGLISLNSNNNNFVAPISVLVSVSFIAVHKKVMCLIQIVMNRKYTSNNKAAKIKINQCVAANAS